MPLLPHEYQDAVNGVINARPLGKNFEYLRDPACPRSWTMLDKMYGNGRWTVQGGSQVEWDVVYQDNNTAAGVYSDQTYQPTSRQFTAKATVPWRNYNANYVVEDSEVDVCRGPEMLYDSIIKPRRLGTMMNLFTTIENNTFAACDGTNELAALSIPYYVVPITTTQISAGTTGLSATFQGAGTAYGTAPTTVAGLDTSTYTRFKNYCDQQDNASGEWTQTNNDRLCLMFDRMQFSVPPGLDMLKEAPFNNLAVYTDRTVKLSMERAAKNQNDNIGMDIAATHGLTVFKSIPITAIDALDTASLTARGGHPVYLINWAFGKPFIREGKFFTERTYGGTGQAPNLSIVHIDISWNFAVTNRGLFGGVLSYVS